MAIIRFILLATLVGLCLSKKRYDGYKVLRVTPSDDFQLRSIANLRSNLLGKVDFWTEPSQTGRSVDLMVGPEALDSVRATLAEHGLETSVMIDDVQQLADQSTAGQPGGIAALADFRYDLYHTFDEIKTWTYDMASEHSDIVSRENLGTSYQGRELNYLKIGKPRTDITKPIFWLMSGVHSREWLSPATVLKIVNLLVTGYKTGVSEIVNILENVDFQIMPMVNPDGYVYSHETDRYWRKTLGKTSWFWCKGVDPNRNWNDHWDDSSSNNNPCSSTYRGPSVFSEPEVKAVADHILSLSGRVKVFIDMHAYSQFWMTPYGWTRDLPPNYQEQKDLADNAMAALKAVNGLTFKTGSIANVIYIAAGSSVDWAYSKAGVPYAFAPELRDKGSYGFVAPSSQIHPSAMEVFAAIKVIANHIISNN